MNKTLIALLTIGALVVGFGIGSHANAPTPTGFLGAVVNSNVSNSVDSLEINGNTVIDSNRALTIGGGTKISKYACVTATWNPPAIGAFNTATSVTSTAIAVSGAVLGDRCTASLSNATGTSDVSCGISANGTSTFWLYNNGTAALDLATGTAQVCYMH